MKLKNYFFVTLQSFACITALAHGDANPEDGFGQAGHPDQINRTVKIEMLDTMRFKPDKLKVSKGETIRFVINNAGAVKHEFVIGTKKELSEHSELMKKHPDMEHADDSMVTVLPRQTAEIIWQFTQGGMFFFACLQPGHYVAGMQGSVEVSLSTHKKTSHQH